MENIEELTEYVSEKARKYLEETGVTIQTFPSSIVDFVIEYITKECHFPENYTEKQIVTDLEAGKNSLAMACVDVYSKIGGEGEYLHTEPSVHRSYESAWISKRLLSAFPNYSKII